MKCLFFKISILFLFFLILTTTANAQIPVPGQPLKEAVLINGGTYHIGNGKTIENGAIIIEKGLIAWIGSSDKLSEQQKKIRSYDAGGKHIYPGLINLNNTLGITEIDAVRASRDFKETGDLNPSVRSMIAYNCESRVITTVRSNGVLITQPTPRGGLISGQSSVMSLDCWNWEDGVILENDGIHLYWPKDFKGGGWWADPQKLKKNENKEKQVATLDKIFFDAKAYNGSPANLNLETIKKLYSGTLNLYIHSNRSSEIIESIEFAKRHRVKGIILVDGAECYKITSYLKENNIPVILKRVHSLPVNKHDLTDQPVKSAHMLNSENILFALSWGGEMEAMNSRNLAFGAGQIVSDELDKEKALQTITLNAAKILRIDNRYGSLEQDKSATLIISTGDLLDMSTSNVVKAFIDGKEVDLDNPQKYLNRKYSDKHGISIGNGQKK